MKIAIISSGFLPVLDGVSVSVFYRLKKLSQYGHQVLLFSPDYSPLKHIYPNWQDYTGNISPEITVISLPSIPAIGLDFERDPTSKSYEIVLQELNKFQPDIIHVDEPERLATRFFRLPGVDYAKSTGIPCVSFFHTNYIEYVEDYFPFPKWVINLLQKLLKLIFARIYNSYDLTLVATKITANKANKIGIKNVYQANLLGVDLNKFSGNLRQEEFWQQQYGFFHLEDQVKLIFLGRITPDKGWNFTIDAFCEMAQKTNLDNLAFIIVGAGTMTEEIKQKLGKLTNNLYLLGKVPPNDVPALLANSDIHVTTSEKETTGLTILEACAAGIPIIAPRAGGVRDNIQEGENGFLYQPQNPKDFLDKLQILVDNPTLRQEMGMKGKEYVNQFSWDTACKNLLEIWHLAIAQKAK
jgi:glycosyltransferase involved in cell wall biosynthesis